MSEDRVDELLAAAALGDARMVLGMIQHGADINSQHSMNGWTSLHWAAHRGHSGLVELLLNSGAKTDIKNSLGQLPGALCKDDITCGVFLRHEVEANVPDTNRNTQATTIIPNYLSNPEFPYTKEYSTMAASLPRETSTTTSAPITVTPPPATHPIPSSNSPGQPIGHSGSNQKKDITLTATKSDNNVKASTNNKKTAYDCDCVDGENEKNIKDPIGSGLTPLEMASMVLRLVHDLTLKKIFTPEEGKHL
eukprot:Ihof_evm2s720 gene=Ihof_evmTU2s720